jgi:hypothetical protein
MGGGMAQLTADQEKYIAESTAHWKKKGVTHVIVRTAEDREVCAYCLGTADTVIRIIDIKEHFEECLCDEGCRCAFYPIVNNSSDLWQHNPIEPAQ